MPAIWGQRDGGFSVDVYKHSSRPGYRVVYRFAGDARSERYTPDEPTATAVAQGIWEAYVKNIIEAPEKPPQTTLDLAIRIQTHPDLTDNTKGRYGRPDSRT